MICPHCRTGVGLFFQEELTFRDGDFEKTGKGHQISWDHCPECGELILFIRYGNCEKSGNWWRLKNVEREELIYPKFATHRVDPAVEEPYRRDFLEACAVLSISPKASAALSRRILQNVLRERFGIKHSSLAKEIEDFIQRRDVPSFLSQAVDAIRNVGNFAAHPLKDTHTGEIVDVEPGEAEWLIEVLEALFDFAFVQPKQLEERKEKLNQKLEALGKPPMKE